MEGPRIDGMSNEDIKNRIYSIASVFICGVDPYLLIDSLIEERVIETEKWQQIEKEYETKRQRCRLLYNHLKRSSHPRAFVIVKETLEKHGHPFLNDLEVVPSISNDNTSENMKSLVDVDQLQEKISSLQERVVTLEQERDTAQEQLKEYGERILALETHLLSGDTSIGAKRKKPNDDSADDIVNTIVTRQRKTSLDVKSVQFLNLSNLSNACDAFVCGVTKLDESIYILCSKFPDDLVASIRSKLRDDLFELYAIRVFEDREPFRLQREVNLLEIGNGVGVLSSDKSKSLYVNDVGEKCIWITNANNFRVGKWLSPIRIRVSEISVTSDGDLLLLTYDHGKDNKLELFDALNATLIRRIFIPSTINYITHAIMRPNGDVVISHSLGDSWREPWAISQLNSVGEITAQYKGGEELPELKDPCPFRLNSHNDLLFVLNQEDDRVDVIDFNSFEFVETLLRSQGTDPRLLCYDDKKKQLILGFLGECSLEVYEIEI